MLEWEGQFLYSFLSSPGQLPRPYIHSTPSHLPGHRGLKVGDPCISATHFRLSNPHDPRLILLSPHTGVSLRVSDGASRSTGHG